MNQFEVTASAGLLRSTRSGVLQFPHRWTAGGVTVEVEFTGAHLLHLAVAGCVLNDTYREAAELNLPIEGVRVRARGDFDHETWTSTGITYSVELRSDASASQLDGLLRRVDEVAEIPRALRSRTQIDRTEPSDRS